MTKVQLVPSVIVEGNVQRPAPGQEPAFYSVYLGEPGGYDWQADFLNPYDAQDLAIKLAQQHKALLDVNFNAVEH